MSQSLKKLKVLFLPVWYPNKYNQIGGCFIKQHALALNPYINLAVFHICADPFLKSIYKFEVSEEDGLLTFRMYYYSFTSKPLKFLNILFYFFAGFIGCFKVMKRFGVVDISHVHVLTRAGIFALIIKYVYNIPFVISEHWSRYLPERNSYHGFFRKLLTSLLVRKSSGISAVSENLKSAIQRYNLNHENFVTIPNTVDFSFFTYKIKEEKSKIRFLHVSSLVDSIKNVTGILNACKLTLEKGYQFDLYIVGDDINREKLINYSRKLAIDNYVFFKGELVGEKLVEQYQQADAFILNSYFENQPCVLLESFSCGLPVIATTAGGIPEIVNNSNGQLIVVDNIEALSESMINFISHNVSYNNALIRDEAEKVYSYPVVANKILDFYNYRIR